MRICSEYILLISRDPYDFIYQFSIYPLCCNNINISPIFSHNAIHHPVIGKNGMVTSQEKTASQIGIDILKKGGNAIDAAVVAGFALAVTHPQAGNLGGGGFMIIHLADKNRTVAIDFREVAPAKAYKSMFLDKQGNVDSNKSRFSIYSIGVPGSVSGLLHALNVFGSLPRNEVIAPAKYLAKNGITVSDELSKSLKKAKSRLSKDPYLNQIFYPNNNVPAPGSKLRRFSKIIISNIKKGRSAFITALSQ